MIEHPAKDYVSLEQWRVAAIDEGIRAADEGRIASHEDVVAWVRSWGRPGELAPPVCE